MAVKKEAGDSPEAFCLRKGEVPRRSRFEMNTESWGKVWVGYQVLRSHPLGDDNLLNLARGHPVRLLGGSNGSAGSAVRHKLLLSSHTLWWIAAGPRV